MQNEHPGLPVPGYVPQSDENIRLVSAMKRSEEIILRSLDSIATMPLIDRRWLAIGRTSIEEGFMAINRSIFRPSRVTDIGDTS